MKDKVAVDKFKIWLKKCIWKDETINKWEGGHSALSSLWTIWYAGYLASLVNPVGFKAIDELIAIGGVNGIDAPEKPGDSLEDNVRYLLDHCPFTVRHKHKGGSESLVDSLIITFTKMQHLLRSPVGTPKGLKSYWQQGCDLGKQGVSVTQAVDDPRWKLPGFQEGFDFGQTRKVK